MAEVIFNYEGNKTIVQCNLNDKMKVIIHKFLIKINKEENNNNLDYLYNGTKIDYELTFNEQANNIDINNKKMNIVVNNNDYHKTKINKFISKDIKCPICKENILIDIKNFKINLSGCKNNHFQSDILLDLFEESQTIDLAKIICDICKSNNKGNTYNNEFYICNTCNKNLCPLCKSIHDKNHKIINYDNKNYICKLHNESYNKFCETCNEDICIICENNHLDHKIFELGKILFSKEDLLKNNNILKNVVDKFKNKISIIKEILDKFVIILDKYYK